MRRSDNNNPRRAKRLLTAAVLLAGCAQPPAAVDTSAAKQRAVCRIDDSVEVERRNVGNADGEPGRADFGSAERSRGPDHRPSVAQQGVLCIQRG